jgi:hypothetical protein
LSHGQRPATANQAGNQQEEYSYASVGYHDHLKDGSMVKTKVVLTTFKLKGQGAPTYHVQVQVEDGLPGMGSGIDHQAVTRLADTLLTGNLACHECHVSQERLFLGLYIFQGGNMSIGNHQKVDWRNGVSISKCCHQIIPK